MLIGIVLHALLHVIIEKYIYFSLKLKKKTIHPVMYNFKNKDKINPMRKKIKFPSQESKGREIIKFKKKD